MFNLNGFSQIKIPPFLGKCPGCNAIESIQQAKLQPDSCDSVKSNASMELMGGDFFGDGEAFTNSLWVWWYLFLFGMGWVWWGLVFCIIFFALKKTNNRWGWLMGVRVLRCHQGNHLRSCGWSRWMPNSLTQTSNHGGVRTVDFFSWSIHVDSNLTRWSLCNAITLQSVMYNHVSFTFIYDIPKINHILVRMYI